MHMIIWLLCTRLKLRRRLEIIRYDFDFWQIKYTLHSKMHKNALNQLRSHCAVLYLHENFARSWCAYTDYILSAI